VSSISYGPGVPLEQELRLCGDVAGKRVVELGVGHAANAPVFAAMGAKAILVDPRPDAIAEARRAAEAAEVRVEFHQNDLADLGFATSASVDLVFSAGALSGVEDLARVFRQVHRVLRPNAALVFSVEHPIATMLEGGQLVIRKAYWAAAPRTVSALFTALSRTDFQVDNILEPAPTGAKDSLVPAALVVRARKLGV
jgi:SAM-dependent methyltransferase